MKTIQTNWKYLKYLFLLGPMLSLMGISAGLVSGIWGAVPLGLLISGIVVIGLWLLLSSSAQSFWNRRSTEAGTNALLATVAMLVILALINFLGVRYPTRVDLTENHLFTLAPESQQVVRSLKQPVKVWVFVRDPNPVDRELLENYRRYGSQFSFEFVDPVVKPNVVERFHLQPTGNAAVYLESAAQQQLVEQLSEGERISEAKLTNSMIKITSARQDKVYFLQGHGEHPLEAPQEGISQAISALQQKNYATEPLNLANQLEVPKDATVVVIDGPKRTLLAGEVQALKNYLASGGSLLVMVDPNTSPGLDSLLQDWGVKLDTRLAIDASGKGRLVEIGPETPLITRYGNHPITKDFGNGISFYPLARPIETTPVVGIEETPLLLTEEQSWAASTQELENQKQLAFNPQTDRKGPLTLGVALSRVYSHTSAAVPSPSPTSSPATTPSASPTAPATPTPTSSPTKSPAATPSASPTAPATPTPTSSPTKSPAATLNLPAKAESADNKPVQSRLVVLGNSEFATDDLFKQELNGDVFLNSISWLSKRDAQTLSIRPKEVKNRRINMTPQQATIIGWMAIVIMPLIGFGTAGLLWWRRR